MKPVLIRFPEDLLKQLDKLAAQQQRSRAKEIIWLLERAIEQQDRKDQR